jgi:hypothetical protein
MLHCWWYSFIIVNVCALTEDKGDEVKEFIRI